METWLLPSAMKRGESGPCSYLGFWQADVRDEEGTTETAANSRPKTLGVNSCNQPTSSTRHRSQFFHIKYSPTTHAPTCASYQEYITSATDLPAFGVPTKMPDLALLCGKGSGFPYTPSLAAASTRQTSVASTVSTFSRSR